MMFLEMMCFCLPPHDADMHVQPPAAEFIPASFDMHLSLLDDLALSLRRMC